MPGRVWGVTATAVAMAGLAIAAAPAGATTDRIDYSDQANPICASANKQVEDLYEFVEAETDRLESLRPRNRKKARRLLDRAERLYEQLPFQFLAIYQAELDQLKSIAPPPGYEGTVASWLATRQEIATLYQQYLQIQQEEDRLFGPPGKRRSRKAIKRARKRRESLERASVRIVVRFGTDDKIDLELGAKLGAAYCVTGATGELPESIIEPSD